MNSMLSERAFIEAVQEQLIRAKELILPVLMLEEEGAPWTSASIERLYAKAGALDPALREAAQLLHAYELPLVRYEEELAAQGLTLERDAAAFEFAMIAFERAFWQAEYQAYRQAPDAAVLGAPKRYDLCRVHRLSKAFVARTLRAHDLTSFEEVAPLIGASLQCGACRLGVTRLLIEELRRAKASGEAV